VVGQLENRLAAGELPARQSLRVIIAELVKFGFDNPQLFELMRNAGPIIKDDRWDQAHGIDKPYRKHHPPR